MAPSSLSNNVIEGRERLVRNRLRWLEGNWDGTPPPSSPWAYSGSRHTSGRRRSTHRRSERAPRLGSPAIPSPSTPSPESSRISGSSGAGGSIPSHSDVTLSSTCRATSPADSSSTVGRNRTPGRSPIVDETKANNDVGIGSVDPVGGTFRSRVFDARARVRRYAVGLPVRPRLRAPAFQALPSTASSEGGSGQSSDDQGLSSGTEDPGNVVYDLDEACLSESPTFSCGDCWRAASPPPPLPPSNHHHRKRVAGRASFLGERTAVPLRAFKPERQLVSLRGQLGEREQDDAETGSTVTDGPRSLGRASSRESLSEVSVAASGFESEDFPEEDPPEGLLRLPKETKEVTAAVLTGTAEQLQSSQEVTADDNEDAASSRRDPGIGAPICEESERRSRRELEEEIYSLKQRLRKAELKQAAVEATVASVLQRARAAEVARDVKEIQVRNLEVKLARYTKSDKHIQEACAQWGQRFQDLSSAISPEFRRHEPLPAVEEEPSSICEPSQSISSAARVNADVGRRRSLPTAALVTPFTSQGTSLSPVRDCSDEDGDIVHVWGARRKKVDGRSRRGVAFGATRASVDID